LKLEPALPPAQTLCALVALAAVQHELSARVRACFALASLDDPVKFVRKALSDELAAKGASLRPAVHEDALEYLLERLLWLARSYRPGTGISFSTFAYPIIRKRYTDFLRQHRGDSRAAESRKPRERDFVSIDAATPADGGFGSEDAVGFDALLTSIDHDRLSTRARGALSEIARRIAEEGITAADAAAKLSKSKREARNDLLRLRAELAGMIS
jgi:DNA-directed RNA polymerase specialized sigma24 family protein